MLHVSLFATDTISLSLLSGFADALGIANDVHQFTNPNASPLFHHEIVTATGKAVTCRGNMKIEAHQAIADVAGTDLVVIPGFIGSMKPAFEIDESVLKWLRAMHAKGASLAGLCTGTFLLARTGLLNGRVGTTNWLYANQFQQVFPEVKLQTERLFTADGGVYCSGATLAWVQLFLHLLESVSSRLVARRVGKILLVDGDKVSQNPYIMETFPIAHGDEPVLRSQKWMEAKVAEPLTMDDAASVAGLSERHFKRRFKKATGDTPIKYLQKLRIEKAKLLLETTRKSVSEIAWEVGYEDANFLRKLFRRVTDITPNAYREKFFVSASHACSDFGHNETRVTNTREMGRVNKEGI